MTRYAFAVIERGRTCWLLAIPHCPFCGEPHSHGGGPLAGDPRRYLSSRVPHCAAAGADMYVLTSDPTQQGQPMPEAISA